MEKQTPQRLNVIILIGLLLYLSRVMAEGGALIGWPVGAIAGGLIGLAAGYGLYRLHLTYPLPLILLWAYVLYPVFDLRVAGLIGLGVGLALLITRFPTPSPRLLDGLVFVSALALYWLTLSPGLLPADAGEFQLTAATLGVAHPPGYPLYTLLGWIFSLLTPGNPMRGVNLFSAVTMALTVMLTGRAARTFSRSVWGGLAAAALIMVADTAWTTGTQASIRPLTAFFTALCLERLAGYHQTGRDGALMGFMLALGLGLTHHPSLIFPGVMFGVYILLIDRRLIKQPKRWPRLIGAFALGFLPWLYLPIRDAMGAPLAPGNLTTWGGFWNHVLARGFAGDMFYFHTAADLLPRFPVWANILRLQWHPVIVIMAVIAAGLLAWRQWRLFVLLGGGFLLHSFITMTYRAPQTVEYLLPAYVLLAVMVGVGISLIENISASKEDTTPSNLASSIFLPLARGRWRNSVRGGLFALILTVSLALGVDNWPSFRVLAKDTSTSQTAHTLLEDAPPDAVILSNWHWATPLWTLQAAESLRPDVEVIYVFPAGAEPLADTWVRHIDAYIESRPVVLTGFYPQTFVFTPYIFEPMRAGWQVLSQPSTDLPDHMQALEVNYGQEAITLTGVDAPDPAQLAVGETLEIRLAWRINGAPPENTTAYVHLRNAAGIVISGSDVKLPLEGVQAGQVLVTRHRPGMPPYGQPTPADSYILTAGLYSVGADGTFNTLEPTGQAWQVPLTVTPPSLPPPTARPRHIQFANGAVLRGYDYEGGVMYLHARLPDGTSGTFPATSDTAQAIIAASISGDSTRLGPWGIPLGETAAFKPPQAGERYVSIGGEMVVSRVDLSPEGDLCPGQTARVAITYLSSRPLITDDIIKVDVIGEGYAWHVQSDNVPAAGSIPTLKWLHGWQVTDTRYFTIPPEATGTATAWVEVAAYDSFTGSILPLLDVELAREGIAVPVGQWVIGEDCP